MSFITEFLHQETPRAGGTMPSYYRKALFISDVVLVIFFLVSACLLFFTTENLFWIPVGFLVIGVSMMPGIHMMSARECLVCFSLLIIAWLTWFVNRFVPVLYLTKRRTSHDRT